MNDHPIIHVYPAGTPSDAELEAERDRKHAAEVADYWRKQQFHDTHDNWPIMEVLG